jgi:hypothetical protein
MPEPPMPAKPFSLCLGARDWEHPAWARGYYPEDLPSDWRLSYYSNDLPQVLVPQARWLPAGEAGWADWLEAVGPEFRFFLELEPGPVPASLEVCAAALEAHCGGVLVPSRRQLPERCSFPVYLVRTLAKPGAPLPGPLPLALVMEPEALGDLRAQRRLFEDLARGQAAQGELPLFLGGDAPSMRLLRDAKQLAELMGLA